MDLREGMLLGKVRVFQIDGEHLSEQELWGGESSIQKILGKEVWQKIAWSQLWNYE